VRNATRTRPGIVVAPVPGPLDRAAYPYALPAVGMPVRVAFVGPRAAFDAHVLHHPTGSVAPAVVDFRAGDDPGELRAALRAAAPHVVVVLGADLVPDGVLGELPAATLGVVTQTVPRPAGGASGDLEAVPAPGLGPLGAYDRVLACDPAVVGLDRRDAVWRCAPLPVDDRIYRSVRPMRRPVRALFVGESTEYRERFLIQAKHEYDVLHYAHGLWGDALREVLGKVDVGLNVHRDRRARFERRVLLHLAAGHLLVSEPLSPLHGLEAEIDFIPVDRADELRAVLGQLGRRHDMHDRVRLRGRAKAEDHRASRVWPRLIGDLLDDVAAFGTERVTALQRSGARGG
jgi:hypothetical protein